MAARGSILIDVKVLAAQAGQTLAALKAQAAGIGQVATEQIKQRGSAAFTTFGNAIKGAGSRLLGFAGRFGQLLFGITTAIVVFQAFALASNAVAEALDFDTQLQRIDSLTDATTKEVEGLRTEILALTRTVPKSPAELGSAAYFILSSGIKDTADAAGILKTSAEAAAVGLGKTEDVADLITSTLNAYSESADMAEQHTNELLAAIREGKGEADEYARTLGRVLPYASELGISFAEVAANIATATQAGYGADEAVTGLRQTLKTMIGPTQETKDALQEIGWSTDYLRESIKEKGLLTTLMDMRDATGGNVEMMDRLIPNIRGMAETLAVTRGSGEDYAQTLRAVKNSQGDLSDAMGAAAKYPSYQLRQAVTDLNTEVVTFGANALPIAVDAVRGAHAALLDFAGAVDSSKGVFIGLGDGLGTVIDLFQWIISHEAALVAAIGAIGVALWALGGPLTQFAVAIGAVVAAISGLKALFGVLGIDQEHITHSTQEWLDTTKELGLELSKFSDTTVARLQRDLQSLGPRFTEAAAKMESGVASFTDKVEFGKVATEVLDLIDVAKRLGFTVPEVFQMLTDAGIDTSSTLLNDVLGPMEEAWKKQQLAAMHTQDVTRLLKLQAEAAGEDATAINLLNNAIIRNAAALEKHKATLQTFADQNKENLQLIEGITSVLTQESVAIDLQVNALSQQKVAMEASRPYFEDAIQAIEELIWAEEALIPPIEERIRISEDEIANIQRDADAIRDKQRALEGERSSLQATITTLQSELTLRSKLAAIALAEAREKSLPDLIAIKKLEAERAQILVRWGGKSLEEMSYLERRRVEEIDASIGALQARIDRERIAAELTNLEAEAAGTAASAVMRQTLEIEEQVKVLDEQATALNDQLYALERSEDAIRDQVAAYQAEVEVVQRRIDKYNKQIEGIRRQADAYDAGTDAIQRQIDQLGYQRDAQDLVIEGWRLMAQSMLDLPKAQDIRGALQGFRDYLLLQGQLAIQQTMVSMIQALAAGDTTRYGALQASLGGWAQLLATIAATKFDTGGIATRPTLALLAANSRPEAVIPLSRGFSGMTIQGDVVVVANDPLEFRDKLREMEQRGYV